MKIATTSSAAINERHDRTVLTGALRRRVAWHGFLDPIIFGACLFSGRSTHGYPRRIEGSQPFSARRIASCRGASPALLAGRPRRLRSGCGCRVRLLASRCWTLRHRKYRSLRQKNPCAKGAGFRRRVRKLGVSVSVPCQWYTQAI
jgi:hypothetical protein